MKTTSASRTRMSKLIEQLNLQPHPEGGWFSETYRGPATQVGARAVSTAIYFLLSRHQHSRFHRIDADECWHYYEGDPVRVHILDKNGYRWIDVGPVDNQGRKPQAIVPARAWFAAETQSHDFGFSLVGCTVAPGFEFDYFELATADALKAAYPNYALLIDRLC